MHALVETKEEHQRSRTKALTLHSLTPLCKPLTVPRNAVDSGQFHAFSLHSSKYPRAYVKGARQVAFECALWRLHLNKRWGLHSFVREHGVDLLCTVLAYDLPLTVRWKGLFVCYNRTTDPLSSTSIVCQQHPASHTDRRVEVFDWRNSRFVVVGAPAH